MKIELESLTLINFKGIKNMMVKFSHQSGISGENATGKTTIFDSFLWLLFGKDSTDRKDFGVKTRDKGGKDIPKIDHEVIGKLLLWNDENEQETLILRRVLRDKWVKPRGQAELVFDGNETSYFVSGVGCLQKEYNDKIESICREDLFKLLTNPAYFPNLNWTVQRGALFALIPEVTFEQIIDTIPSKAKDQGKFLGMAKILNSEKEMDDQKKRISAEKRRLKDELDLIPARIDEVNRALPEVEDWEALEQAIGDGESYILRRDEVRKGKLSANDDEISKRAASNQKYEQLVQRNQAIHTEVGEKIRGENKESGSRAQDTKDEITKWEDLMQKNVDSLVDLRIDMAGYQTKRTSLIEEWQSLSAEQFSYLKDNICFNCNQELPEDMILRDKGELEAEFNKQKKGRLDVNMEKGRNHKIVIERCQGKIDELVEQNKVTYPDAIKALNMTLQGINAPSTERTNTGVSEAALDFVKELSTRLNAHIQYQSNKTEADAIKIEMSKIVLAPIDVSAIEKEISDARAILDENKKKFNKREQITAAGLRIKELEESQKTLSQQIADLEQSEFTIETFIRTKVEMLEKQINGLFKLVRFRMFEMQINGQLAETCECSIDGVPYSDLNNAARINAGIDIINTMSIAYSIIAPIFIDNRESVNVIIPTNAQLISLYVTKDKELIFT